MITQVRCHYQNNGDFGGFEVRAGLKEWVVSKGMYYTPVLYFLNRRYLDLAGDEEQFVPLVKADLETLVSGGMDELFDLVLLKEGAYSALTCAQRFLAYEHSCGEGGTGLLRYSAANCISSNMYSGNKRKNRLYTLEHLMTLPEEDLPAFGDYHETPEEVFSREVTMLDEKNQKDYHALCRLITRNPELNFGIQTQHTFSTLSDMLRFLIAEMIRLNVTVKKCENCGSYFVPTRSDARYCNESSPQKPQKSCQQYRKYTAGLAKTRNDEAARLYKQIYNTKNNKIRRYKAPSPSKGNPALLADLNRFMAVANQYKQRIAKGEASPGEYVQWLREEKSAHR